ncbi:MAG: pantetheine-phosphate adenylyltransferase [Thermoplasmata archaeon]
MNKKVILGGTFHELHRGHKKMLKTALDMGDVTIGLVSDEFLSRWKPHVDAPMEIRKRELEEYLSRYDNWEIVEISDPYSEALDGKYHVLVVSWDTKERGMEINEMRRDIGENSLDIVVVPPVLAQDLIPISSTRIRQELIDRAGKRLKPVKIHVGSENVVKIQQVEKVFSKLFETDIVGNKIDNTRELPVDQKTIEQAKKRAAVPPGYDYGIGIESGLFAKHDTHMSAEYAVIRDSTSFETLGHGLGYPVPERWMIRAEDGESLKDIMEDCFREYENKAVDALSRGALSREQCIRSALTCALIPRLNIEHYAYGFRHGPVKRFITDVVSTFERKRTNVSKR